jgi:hypothetical protein
MLLRELDYARPGSVEEAVQLLSREDARALAGGQSLVNVMKTRVASPELVVDLNGIDGLRGIRAADGALEIGRVAHVAGHREGAEAYRLGLENVFPAREHDDVGAFLCERLGRREPEPGRCAADDRSAAVEAEIHG